MTPDIDRPGTVDDLIADASAAGHRATVRLVRDWSHAGLLDQPAKRSAGRGRGSLKAIYSSNQRRLFRLLLDKRSTVTHISSLARIPVALWTYWGDGYVPTRQARRAFMTWLGDGRASSREHARTSARALIGQLDHPNASKVDRTALFDALVEATYCGRIDLDKLEPLVAAVFEPGFGPLHRAVGHPDALLSTDAVMKLIMVRFGAVQRLRNGKMADVEFRQARDLHRLHYADYLSRQPEFARHDELSKLYDLATAEQALVEACENLLTLIGLTHGSGIVPTVLPTTEFGPSMP